MAISRKAERSLLSHDEFEAIANTHSPALTQLSDDELAALRGRIRDTRLKQRTLVGHVRRALRGKGDQRGSSFPGNAEHATERKQVFAAAMKRLNAETTRRRGIRARGDMRSSLETALRRKRNAGSRKFPIPGRTPNTGMRVQENKRSKAVLERADVGRSVATNKAAQAKQDARPS